MSLYKDASLAMIPSAYKDGKLYSIRPTDGSGDFTFSRGSNLAATRVDVNGLIEKGRENLLTYSNDFSNAAWDKNIISITSGQADKDGGTTASRLTANSGGQFRRLQQTTNKNAVVTASVFVKAGTANFLYMVHSSGSYSSGGYQFFDLANGTLGASSFLKIIDSSIEDAGNGWYKCTLVSEPDAAGNFYIGISNNDTNTNVNNGLYVDIQDAQLEQGLVATDYIETGTSAAQSGILEDMPRLDYSGGASCPSLLLEPQRANLTTHSEYLANYPVNRGSVSSNVATSPEGVQNAASLVPTTDNGDHTIQSANSLSATTYTISCFAKNNGNDISLTLAYNASNWTGCIFDLANGETKTPQQRGVQSVCTANIEPYGDGWYRCSITATLWTAYGGWFTFVSLVNNADGPLESSWGRQSFVGVPLETAYLYGLQIEQGSYPTSYIPTYGSSVTRSADSCVSSSLTTSTDFTIFFEAPNFCLINGSTGGSYDNIQFVFSENGGPYVTNGSYHIYNNTLYYYNGSSNTGFGQIYNNQTDSKFVIMKRGDKVLLFANGAKKTEATLPSGGNVSTWDTINLTQSLEDGQKDVFGSTYKQVVKFDTALTDSECIALTTL